jgi:predicted O-methyltransferase YrrM
MSRCTIRPPPQRYIGTDALGSVLHIVRARERQAFSSFKARWSASRLWHSASVSDVAVQLLDLAGGDRFDWVRDRSQIHQAAHGCGLHNAGGPVMHLISSIARASTARRVLDLGSGLGYSTMWLADAVGPEGTVIGIDEDGSHTAEAERIAVEAGLSETVSFRTGRVVDVLPELTGTFDLIHDDAWFAGVPEHLESMLDLLELGGVLTMANWFLLVDALTGEPRNDWESLAGPEWAARTLEYAQQLAARTDLSVNWITMPPVAFATNLS